MRRKNPYSFIDVNEILIEVLTRARAGQAARVGVDVAKGELIACVVWPDGSFDRPWRARSPEQVGELVSKLKALHWVCPVTVSMESSGTYGDAFRQALHDGQMVLHRVSAKAVKDYSETFDGVPSQHDGKDAAIIGTLSLQGRSVVWEWDSVANECDAAIRYWVRKLDTSQRIKQIWCGKLEAMLARHWPEAGRLTNQSGATLLRALVHWGDPAALAKDPGAAKLLRKFGGHYLSDQKIAQLIESAKKTVGVRMNTWASRELRDIAGAITRRRRQIQTCRRELKKLTKDHVQIQAQAAAVGHTTACVLWMCLGDAANYSSAGAYRKAMGLNLKERSSGRQKGELSISKRGQRLGRKWLYFSALRWMREPSVKKWLENKKQRDGGHGSKAATGIMRRLAMAAWHAGLGEVFDPRRLFPGSVAPQ